MPYATANAAIPNVRPTANAVYSVQRFQPYRGGHAVPVSRRRRRPAPTSPVDTALRLQRADRRAEHELVRPWGTQGIYYIDTTGTAQQLLLRDPADLPHPGLGQRIRTGLDQPPGRALGLLPVPRPRLHQRGRAVAGAGLLARALHQAIRRVCSVVRQHHQHLQPACSLSPGRARLQPARGLQRACPPRPGTRSRRCTTATATLKLTAPASTPLALHDRVIRPAPRHRPPPIQPHTFPYLIDKFFYSAYGAIEHARPGWPGRRLRGRRLVQDVRVPRSPQPDDRRDRPGREWGRISTGRGRTVKPGQLNLNLIIDEEVFFSVVGPADHHVSRTANTSRSDGDDRPDTRRDQFTQRLLNFDQIPCRRLSRAGSNRLVTLAALTRGTTRPPAAPLLAPLAGTPPIPMVVTSTHADGGPASAYPALEHGVASTRRHPGQRPDQQLLLASIRPRLATGIPPQYTPTLSRRPGSSS